MLNGADKFSPENKEILAKMKRIIENYEKTELIDNNNALQFLFEE